MTHHLQQIDPRQAEASVPSTAARAAQETDPQKLWALAQDQSVAGRRSLALSMTDLFGGNESGLSERSRELAAQILDRLIRAFETEIRRELSERLAGKADVPRELILMLANDRIEVARPVLLESQVLTSLDLIELIRNQGTDHQLAIAMRRTLTEPVCDALVGSDNVSVIEALLKNERAPISQGTMDYLVEEAHWVEAYRAPLVQRQELQPPLAKRLYSLVSAALREHILEHFDIDPEGLDDEMEEIVASKSAGPSPSSAAPAGNDSMRFLVDQGDGLQPEEITAQHLITLLRSGNRALFEQHFAQLSGLRPPRLGLVLYGSGGRDLAVTCRALGMDKNAFAVIVFLCRQGGPGDEVQDPRTVAQVIDYFNQMEPEAAQARLRQWQRDPDYVAGIEELDSRPG